GIRHRVLWSGPAYGGTDLASPARRRTAATGRHLSFRPVVRRIPAPGVFFGSRLRRNAHPQGRRSTSTEHDYSLLHSRSFASERPRGRGLKRRPAHPLLAVQLRRAGIEIEGENRIEPAAV